MMISFKHDAKSTGKIQHCDFDIVLIFGKSSKPTAIQFEKHLTEIPCYHLGIES